ncbi:MAG: hypothetical protein R3F53_08665 [Gammaproteobacteria bacterium]
MRKPRATQARDDLQAQVAKLEEQAGVSAQTIEQLTQARDALQAELDEIKAQQPADASTTEATTNSQ